jgi:hypothetical protein
MTEETNQENTDLVLSLSLRISEINVVLAGLQELPFKVADPLLKNIIAQAQAQVVPQPMPEPELVD